MESEQQHSTQSETPRECRALTEALYLLSSQWPIPPEKMAGKRFALLQKLREVGEKRLLEGIGRCCVDHIDEFCPPMGIINGYIPAGTGNQSQYSIENEREQARRARMYREGSDEIISGVEAQVALRWYADRRQAGEDFGFNRFWKEFIAKRAEVRKAGGQMQLEKQARGGEMRQL